MSTGLRAGTNNDGYLQVNGTDVLTALSSGRIGIGTTNPQQKLHVYTTSGNDGIVVENISTANIAFTGAKNGEATVQMGQFGSTASGTTFGLTNSNLSFIYTTSYGTTHPSALAIGTVSNIPAIIATNNTERLRVSSTGNVGIGTTNPLGKLHTLAGTGGMVSAWLSGDFIFDGGTAKNDTELTLIGGVYTQVNSVRINLLTAGNDFGYGLGQRIRVQKDTSGAGGNHSLYLDRVNTDGSGNRTITTLTKHSAAGDVFLNNSTSKFIGQCEDAVFIGTTAISASNYFVGMETRLGADRDLVIWSKTGDAGGNIIFKNGYTTNGSVNETVRIKTDGNVGIGVTNPTIKLQVNGSIYTANSFLMGNGEQSTSMYSGSQITVSNNTWYTVTNFAFQYNLIAFLLFVSFENSAGDGNNTTALFMSPGTASYAGGGAAPIRIAGATTLEAQIVNSYPYNLQVRTTAGAGGTGDSRLRWWVMSIPGN